VFPYEQLIKAPFPAGVDINKREVQFLKDFDEKKTIIFYLNN